MKQKHRLTGFTLIEMVTILSIVAILAYFAVSRWPGEGINLAAQAEQLAADIRYTQNLSMTRGKPYHLDFTSNSYTIADHNDTPLLHPGSGTNRITLANGVILSYSHSRLSFNAKGIPFGQSNTALSNNAILTLASGSTSKQVLINPQTGRVSLL